MKNNVVVQKYSDCITVVNTPQKKAGEWIRQMDIYHLYPPCRPTDLVQSELCVVFVICFDKEMLNT